MRWLPGWLWGHVAFSEGWSGRGFYGGFEGAFGRASGRLRKDLSVGLRGHVSYSERAPKGSSGLVCLERGFPKGESFGRTFIVGLEINGWDSSVRSDRGELRSDRPKCLGRCGPLDFRSTARVGRPVRTDRTVDRFLAVGSDLDGYYSIGGVFFSKGWATGTDGVRRRLGGASPESSPEARPADGNRSGVGRLDAGG